MSQDDRESDPLLRAIQEMRREILGWIDERIVALRQRPIGAGTGAASGAASVSGAASASASASADDVPGPPREEPVVRAAFRAGSIAPPAAAPALAEEEARRGVDDPRQRLDNLARHLGERLKLAEPRGPEPAEPTSP